MPAQVIQLKRSLGRQLQIIAKDKPSHLRVLKDKAGYNAAQKLYGAYVSQDDFSKFPLFCQELDHLLHRYGGQVEEPETADQETDKLPKQDQDGENDRRDKF
jgi:hypothetical protein